MKNAGLRRVTTITILSFKHDYACGLYIEPRGCARDGPKDSIWVRILLSYSR
jgi:hypothetical protein